MKKNLLVAALVMSSLTLSTPAFAKSVISVGIGTKTFTDRTIQNGSAARGGGIFNKGTVNILSSTIKNNTATNNGGGIAGLSPVGNMNISDTTFENNTVSGAKADGGGAIYLQSSASKISEIKNSTFYNNTSYNSSTHDSDGGAITLGLGTLNIYDTEFNENKSDIGGAINVRTNQKAILNVYNSTFTKNEASSHGAIGNFGVANITNSKFIENKATSASSSGGGAMFLGASSKTSITGTEFTGNTSEADGGAIRTRLETPPDGALSDNSSAVLDIIDSTFKNNTAKKNGGAIFNTFYNSENNAGAVTILNSKFDKNTADGYGGAIYNASKDAVGNAASINISNNSVFTENSAVRGGAIYNEGKMSISDAEFSNNNGSYGGAVYNMSKENVSINNTTFTENTAKYSGGALAHNLEGVLNIENSLFEGNTAKSSGGAIWAAQKGLNIVNNVQFNKNSAQNGGALYVTKGATIGDNIVFSKNEATGKYGGGAINNKGELTINDNVSFSENQAAKYGGAIYSEGGLTIQKDAIFSKNHSDSLGGAIYLKDSGTTKIGENAKFLNNDTLTHGGAIYIKDGSHNLEIGNNAVFSGNHNKIASTVTRNGGAIYAGNSKGTVKIKDNAVFYSNEANGNGGAILNHAKEMTIGKNAQFISNTSHVWGGAIYNYESSLTLGEGALFQENSAMQGGAIFQNADTELTLNNAVFSSNKATGDSTSAGGAIFIGDADTSDVKITNSIFDSNSSDVAGGAIQQSMKSTSAITVENSTFNNNSTSAEGGAITSDSNLNVINSTFIGNKTTSTKVGSTINDNDDGGGAIMLYDDAKATITGSTFVNNSSGTYGGAIGTRTGASNDKSSLTVKSTIFDGNTAGVNGGAIASHVDAVIKDSSFTNNSAAKAGGGVWGNQNITISAENSDVVFSGNSASDGGDIYMAAAGKDLNMNIADGRKITSASGISGDSGKYNFNVTGGGTLDLASYLKNADMTVDNSTLVLSKGDSQVNGNNNSITVNGGGFNILNNHIDRFDDGLVTLNGNIDIAADIDLGNGEGDFLTNLINDSTVVNISEINAIANTTKDNVTIDIKEALGLQNANNVNITASTAPDVLSPIRYLKGSIDENGLLSYAPAGKSYKDFNPSVLAAPVAAQLGGYFAQLNSYDEAFRNLDMKMLMTQEERKALRMRNSYAAAGGSTTPMVFSPTYLPEKEKAGWVRPYASFENVPLKNGPKVSNVMYGTFFGADSEMYELENGAMVQFSAYAGYNGSHQAFSGNSIYQNGGNLGLTGIIYKGNFFSALTANVGASVAEASTMYGSEDFPMLMAGVASKTGYNWELAKGKFIIQPNYLMSYTFVNTFDYTNAAGVRIKSDPLNAIQIAPGLKFIGNLKHGWQPYINLRMVWNIMDKTDFMAAQTSLPGLSTKPYFEYGVGLQKRWGERFTGFGQAMIRNGGRNGIALGFGFRWAVGQAPSKAEYNTAKKVIKQPAQLKLSNIK